MAKICELCQQKASSDMRFGVYLCEDCLRNYNKAFTTRDPEAISWFSNPENFPYATKAAQHNVIEVVANLKPGTTIKPRKNTDSPINNFLNNNIVDKKPASPIVYRQPTNTDSSLDGLYENIGKKIKNWAKWIFVLEAIAAVISGLALLLDGGDGWWIGLLLIFVGPLIALVSTWLLYGFGELIEKTATNEQNTSEILKIMKQNKND